MRNTHTRSFGSLKSVLTEVHQMLAITHPRLRLLSLIQGESPMAPRHPSASPTAVHGAEPSLVTCHCTHGDLCALFFSRHVLRALWAFIPHPDVNTCSFLLLPLFLVQCSEWLPNPGAGPGSLRQGYVLSSHSPRCSPLHPPPTTGAQMFCFPFLTTFRWSYWENLL